VNVSGASLPRRTGAGKFTGGSRARRLFARRPSDVDCARQPAHIGLWPGPQL